MAAEAERAVDHGGHADALHRYWVHGEGAAKIAWGTPGDFDRCVVELGKYIHDPKGYCNLAHHAALGIYPATHAKEDSGRAAMTAETERFNPNHVPGGAGGGQFTSGGGGSGGAGKANGAGTAKGTAAAKAHAAHEAHLAHMAHLKAHPVAQGEHGKRVSDVQDRLNALGAKPPLASDGIFGPKTLAAVKAFQRAHGLKADGLVGPKTMAALDAAHAAHAGKPKAPAHHVPAVQQGAGHKAGRSAMAAETGLHITFTPGTVDPAQVGKQVADAIREYGRAAKPYGDVEYADPKNGKYPIDTAAHAKAAWSYISKPDNAAKYPVNGVTLAEVKARIMAACKKFGIDVNEGGEDESNAAHFAPDVDVVRSGGGLELQPADDGSLGTLTGRFSEFGRWYPVSSRVEGNFMERVAPGSTMDTIRDDLPGMRVLFDHGMDGQIGNKVLGPIASLEERSDGPWYEVPLFDTSYNRDLLPGLRAGVYGASMRMRVLADSWNDDPQRSDANPDGIPERTITRMKVPEFGPVTFGANPGATAGIRSATDDFYARLAQADAPAFADAARACGLSLEDFTGRLAARSGPGREQDVQPGHGRTSPTTLAALRDRAWRMREVR